MEANKILNTSLLDILFEGRNKEYGAYELRKNSNRRLMKALFGMTIFTVSLFLIAILCSQGNEVKKQALMVNDVLLEEVREERKNEAPPPPPKEVLQKIEVTKFTPPKIVKDNEVREEDKPPEQQKLEETKIGAINQEGVKDDGIAGPLTLSDAGKGLVEAPKPKVTEDYEKTFMKVEIESEYPGGRAAWLRYLNKNFRYPDEALNNAIEGVVMVQYVVDKEGNVSDVEAIGGPDQGGLRDEAIRVIRKSGLWIPAIQNGQKVKSYKKQPVVFKLMEQS